MDKDKEPLETTEKPAPEKTEVSKTPEVSDKKEPKSQRALTIEILTKIKQKLDMQIRKLNSLNHKYLIRLDTIEKGKNEGDPIIRITNVSAKNWFEKNVKKGNIKYANPVEMKRKYRPFTEVIIKLDPDKGIIIKGMPAVGPAQNIVDNPRDVEAIAFNVSRIFKLIDSPKKEKEA